MVLYAIEISTISFIDSLSAVQNRLLNRANWFERLNRRRFNPDRPRNRIRGARPVDQDVRIRQQLAHQRNLRIDTLTRNNQARRIQRAWRNILNERNRNRRILHLTANNQARIIQRAWRNRIRRNIENNLNNRENLNAQQNPDVAEEVEAIRNGELPVDEDGYVHFGDNGNQPEEEINLNDDPNRPINQEDIEPQMYFGGGYENIPGGGAKDGGDSEGEDDDPEPQFVVQHHRIFDNDSPIERQRRRNIMEYNRRHGAPRFIYVRNILDDGLTTIIFDPYAYKGLNFKARNKYVLYWNKENSTIGIKFVEYHPPAEGENNRSNFRPDFNKRKIFYLHVFVFDNFNDIGFRGWDVNIESFQRTSMGNFIYTPEDLGQRRDKYIDINIGNANYQNLQELYVP
ncbi:hypothetical protein PIROE2DRAFT_3301 [Piromyces sp. E2]|nr:hypothetical protein PIROE2DRAFT_3301 [Piromyces sp. E2]|eukprot:OUM68910.1 hypothetical protein PIROE2DRAFT_3301 [Piromyces sp. E2]